MKTYRHKTLWLVFLVGGGITECRSQGQARVLALNNPGVFCIRPPIYGGEGDE